MRDGRTVMTSRMADIDKLHLVAAMLGRDLETVRAHSTGFSAAHATAGDVVLSAEGLRIGRKVRDARVEVRQREIVGLAGLLGSGRTEVARAIFGADPPDAGTIRLNGQARLAARAGRGDRARRRLLQRGPQGGRHRSRHVGAREHDARHPAAADEHGNRR